MLYIYNNNNNIHIAYLLNFEDDHDRLLEHQYESTPARYLYRACCSRTMVLISSFSRRPWSGQKRTLQCPFLTHQHSSIVGDLC